MDFADFASNLSSTTGDLLEGIVEFFEGILGAFEGLLSSEDTK